MLPPLVLLSGVTPLVWPGILFVGLPMGLPKSPISAIQSVLNAAARLIAHLLRRAIPTPIFPEVLHRLPISSRIKFMVLHLVFKSRFGLAPFYLTDRIEVLDGGRQMFRNYYYYYYYYYCYYYYYYY